MWSTVWCLPRDRQTGLTIKWDGLMGRQEHNDSQRETRVSFFSCRKRKKECTREKWVENTFKPRFFMLLRVCAYKQSHCVFVIKMRIYVHVIASMSNQCVLLSCKEALLWWYYNPAMWHKLSVEEGLNQGFSLCVIICAFHVQATRYSHWLLKLWRIIQAHGRQKHFGFRLKNRKHGNTVW